MYSNLSFDALGWSVGLFIGQSAMAEVLVGIGKGASKLARAILDPGCDKCCVHAKQKLKQLECSTQQTTQQCSEDREQGRPNKSISAGASGILHAICAHIFRVSLAPTSTRLVVLGIENATRVADARRTCWCDSPLLHRTYSKDRGNECLAASAYRARRRKPA